MESERKKKEINKFHRWLGFWCVPKAETQRSREVHSWREKSNYLNKKDIGERILFCKIGEDLSYAGKKQCWKRRKALELVPALGRTRKQMVTTLRYKNIEEAQELHPDRGTQLSIWESRDDKSVSITSTTAFSKNLCISNYCVANPSSF